MKTCFSLVIPVAPYRDAEVLQSLEKLEYPKEMYEILVHHGPSASGNRNKGVHDAQFEWIVFLDDDAVLPIDLLENADSFIQNHASVDLFGGPQLTPPDDGYFAKTSGYVLASYFGSQRMRFRYIKGKENLNADENYLTTALCFVKKSVFATAGYFDESLFPGEDPEFFARVKKHHFILAYAPSVFLYHRRRANYKGFLKQIYLYGKVRLFKEKKGNTLVKPLYLLPSFFVLYLIAFVPLLFLSWLFVLPFLLYLFLAFLSSFLIVLREKNYLSFPLLLLLFLSQHLAYGVGLLHGFFQKHLNETFK